jgi:hypothetical protein
MQNAQPAQNAQLPQNAHPAQHMQPVGTAQVKEAAQTAQPAQQPAAAQTPNIPELAPVGPSFFGYKAPKWAKDFDYVRNNQGKGSEHDSDTWLVTMIDRLLKKHSI